MSRRIGQVAYFRKDYEAQPYILSSFEPIVSSSEVREEARDGMCPVKCVKALCSSTSHCSLARHQLRLFCYVLLSSI